MILGYSVDKQTEFLCRYKRVLLRQRSITLRFKSEELIAATE